ncbi:hypothetical protein C2E21_8792 [Chlorella sorokiniana]|uniref:Uncharacterized protein n=1 Tax=Chlorella sorokiniana TaxID=3076 RepID=A0A2P6TDD3_CHLSO|nr:hypothetical protein C2E21_8792 [Chlorella sorokiniana]|eukprot:PRW20645.1 hypothetical protein C2E21_8792 [Chlorella sorokiniana]
MRVDRIPSLSRDSWYQTQCGFSHWIRIKLSGRACIIYFWAAGTLCWTGHCLFILFSRNAFGPPCAA